MVKLEFINICRKFIVLTGVNMCGKRLDLAGIQLGHLTVLEATDHRSSQEASYGVAVVIAAMRFCCLQVVSGIVI